VTDIQRRPLPSDCYGRRPGDPSAYITPRGIVFHWISDRWGHYGDEPYSIDSIVRLLSDLGLSYHTVIGRDGTRWRLVDTVPQCYRAFHAGVSKWKARTDCNNWMIGVALMGMDGDDYTDRQYDSLATEIAEHVQAHPIKRDCLPGHCDVAPDRKSDPGPQFDRHRVEQAIGGLWKPS